MQKDNHTEDPAGLLKQKKLGAAVHVSFSGKTELIANMIVKDLCITGISEKTGFRELMEHLAPGIKTPSRSTVRRLTLKKAAAARKAVKDHLKELRVRTHITTDCWSDKSQRSFGSFTVSYVDEDFNLKSLSGDISRMEGRHTAVNLAKWLTQKIEENASWTQAVASCNARKNEIFLMRTI